MVVSMGGSQCAGGVRCPQFLAGPASTLVYSLPRLFTPTLGFATPTLGSATPTLGFAAPTLGFATPTPDTVAE